MVSGPIVRKYGFPNFDKIFGERPLQHGIDELDQPVAEPEGASPGKGKQKPTAKPKTSRTSKTKK